MRVRKLDESGDIQTSGKIWAYRRECIAQTIKTRLKLFLGEYFRDITDGVQWFEKEDGSEGILGKGYQLAQIEAIIRQRIMRTDGVLKILTFAMDFDSSNRKLSIEVNVLSKYGRRLITWAS